MKHLRTVAATTLALALTCGVAAADISTTPPPVASGTSAPLLYTGTVDAAGQAWEGQKVEVDTPGDYRAELTWSAATADLNLFVKDPSGD